MIHQAFPCDNEADLRGETVRPWFIVSEHPDHIGDREAESIVAVELGRVPSQAFASARKRSAIVRDHEARGRIFFARGSYDKIISTGWLESGPAELERTWVAVGPAREEIRSTARICDEGLDGYSVEIQVEIAGVTIPRPVAEIRFPTETEAFKYADEIGAWEASSHLAENQREYRAAKKE